MLAAGDDDADEVGEQEADEAAEDAGGKTVACPSTFL